MTDFARRLARLLADRSDTLFGVPGGGPNLDVVGACSANGMRFVLAHGEAEAAIMASTYGLLTGGPTGVVVTRGPGAACALNGAAQATLDRFPLVVITDCVTQEQSVRISHQRFDQRAMLTPVTVGSLTATASLDDDTLVAAVDRAALWPPGAVHLDYDPDAPAPGPGSSTAAAHEVPVAAAVGSAAPAGPIGEALELLTSARRPMVIVGMEAAWLDHQARLTGAEPPIRRLLEHLGCPVLTTYQAAGLVPTEGPLNAGIWTNGALEQAALDQADLLLFIGVDTVEPIPTPWRQSVPVVTISAAEPIDAFLPADHALLGDLATMAHQLVSGARHRDWSHEWPANAAVDMREAARRVLRPPSPVEPLGPVALVDALLAALDGMGEGGAGEPGAGEPPIVTVDAGAHFLAVMPRWPVEQPFELLISNGLATMGFALPAAIAAALASPGRRVLALVGDGGLSMTMAELETMARLDLPITVVVLNDSALSLIAVKQREGHGGPEAIRYRPTDFATIAAASGLQGDVAETADDVRRLLAEPVSGPRLVDARIDPADYRHLIQATRG